MPKIAPIFLCFLLIAASSASGQFSSGSTGVDGPLDTSTMNCPGAICTLQLPESGTFNFTTVNVAASTNLIFRKNSRNTSVTVLAQGNVVIGIGATITLDAPVLHSGAAPFNEPGPGGFFGGDPQRNGFGPGGGIHDPGNPNLSTGRWVGPLSLVPNVGGSGGASGGCGGGGAITVASSTSITVQNGGWIIARAVTSPGLCVPNSGSGGAIRLVANAINIAGRLEAVGRINGVIRLETDNLTFTGSTAPIAVHSTINPVVVLSAVPRLSIVSVGGYSVPANSGTRFDLIDLLLPNQIPDPVSVGVAAQNIPVGTQVQIGFVNSSQTGTSTPCSLSGTHETSSCTAAIANLNRTGGTYLLATAIFAPPLSTARFNPAGPNHVAKVSLESPFRDRPKYAFLRSNGTKIAIENLSTHFLSEFGEVSR